MNIVIILQDGVIDHVISDEKANVIIVDRDIDGVDPEETTSVLDRDSYVYEGLKTSTVNIEIVNRVMKEVNRNDEN